MSVLRVWTHAVSWQTVQTLWVAMSVSVDLDIREKMAENALVRPLTDFSIHVE